MLKPANKSQRGLIKRYLGELGGHADNTAPFECEFEEVRLSELSFEHHSRRLRSDRWRYYVVSFIEDSFDPTHGSKSIELLRGASKLTDHALRLDPSSFKGGWWTNFTSDWEYFTEIAVTGGSIIPCDAKYLGDLKYCFASVQNLQSTHPDIARSIQMYNDLPDRRGYNELTTLGLFSVLESLLTHNPRGEIDSINRQIRKKITLVQRRLPRQISYSYFDSAPTETIWNKLYEFRSRIAHGGNIDFDKSLSLLRDSYTVESFLKEAIRLVLRGALEEPDLFIDLRAV